MNGRRILRALGAGLLTCLPLALLFAVFGGGWTTGSGMQDFVQTFGSLLLAVAVASALGMALMVLVWDRLSWRPRGRAAWAGVFLLACLLGATLTGLLTSALYPLLSLLDPSPLLRPDEVSGAQGLGGLLSYVGFFAVTGVADGFLSLSAPLGGLLFVLLARGRPEISSTPARYTPPHD